MDHVSKNIGQDAEKMTAEDMIKEVRKRVEEKKEQENIHEDAMNKEPIIISDDEEQGIVILKLKFFILNIS